MSAQMYTDNSTLFDREATQGQIHRFTSTLTNVVPIIIIFIIINIIIIIVS